MVKKVQIKYIFLFLAVFLFLLFIGSGNVISPFYGDLNLIDEGQYAAWVLHMRSGELIYKNTYAAYGPLIIYPFYIFSKFFDLNFFNLRIVFVLFNLISISIVLLIFKKLNIKFLIQLFIIFMLIFIPGFGIRQAGGLLVIYFAYLAISSKNKIYSFLTGNLLVISFLISSDIGIFTTLVLFIMFVIKFFDTSDFVDYTRKLILIFFGILFSFIIFYIFSNNAGWFYSYMHSIIDDLKSYSGIGIPIGSKFPNAIELFPQQLTLFNLVKYIFSKEILNYWLIFFYILSVIYFIIKFLVKKIEKIDLLAFSLTLFGILLSTIIIGRLNNFTFVLPVVFIMFAYYLNLISMNIKTVKSSLDKITYVFLALLILVFCFREISIYRPHFKKVPIAIASVGMHKSNLKGLGNILISKEQEKDIRFIQEFVSENTKEQEKIFFLSNNPGLYLFVNRISPTRFNLPGTANTRERRFELIKDLENNKTKYIIEDTKAYSVDGISNRVRLPEVMKYIMKNYDKQELRNYIIYKRKS